jgi:NADH-quinone oxidoreductase subunit M
MIAIPWITLTVFLPLIGAAVLAFVPGDHRDLHRSITTLFMGLTFLVSIPLVTGFDPAIGGYQLTTAIENVAWIEAIGARYHVGIDGISLWLVMLTTFLGPIVALSGYGAVEERVKEYHIALLVLQTAMLGAFVALDLVLFYVFWELMLVPMYFLIGIWGGKERVYAAVKLFLYTMLGSVLMLIGILYIYVSGGGESFSIEAMTQAAQSLSFGEQRWLFVAFALAFLIKVPLFPFHTWLPDAHVQAPTAGSVILASILLKMGTYGLIRYAMPMMPDAVFWAAPTIAVLSVVGIVYGALVAYVQKDVKKLIAYSSVSHLGFVTLGLFAMTATSVTGAVYQSLAHGISTGGLFLAIGIVYERRHTRLLSEFGGLARQIPVFALFFVIVALASAGVPGLVGFVGEFMILTGSSTSYALNFGELSYFFGLGWGPDVTAFVFVAVAASGVILGALYLLWMLQKMLFGPLDNPKNKELRDLSPRELTYMIPMVLMCFVMGLFPQPFISRMDASVERFIDTVERGAVVYAPVIEENARRGSDYQRWLDSGAAEHPWEIESEVGGDHGDDHASDGHH